MSFCSTDEVKDCCNGFTVNENACTLDTQQRYETVLCLGNGYMGIRSAFCEPYLQQSGLTLIAGLYDHQPKEEEELLPLPDVTGLTLTANGAEIGPLHEAVTNYSRSLNLENGLLTYSYRYTSNDQAVSLKVTQRRFVSMEQRHLAVFETVVKAEKNVQLMAVAAISARQTVNGTQHSFEEECTVWQDHLLWYGGRAVVARTAFRVGLRVKCFLNGQELADVWRYSSARRLVSCGADIKLAEGDELRIVRYALFYTEHDQEWSEWGSGAVNQSIVQEMDRVSNQSFVQLLTASEQKWKNIWRHCNIGVRSDDSAENLKIRLALYHMIIMCPSDERISIAAKGLTGMGYAGHVFWDCEIFNLPFFTYTAPQAAKKLCQYRYHTLDGARKKAHEFGFSGAMYPWESASVPGYEQCPKFKNYSPDNTPRHIACGEIEHHVVCDVAYGIYSYAQVTDDRAFMEDYGLEILFETADFWQSRLDYHSEKDRYEILQVTGPDEYKEYVDNDVFTNYMVAWNLKTALSEAEYLQQNEPVLFEKFEELIDLSRLMQSIRQKLPKLYLPVQNKNGFIPQNDTYLNLPEIDLTKYKVNGVNRLIQKDHTMRQIGQLMVSKQADLIQLIALLPQLFDVETIRRNTEFYEARCIHDSSLSLSAYAMVTAQIGNADLAHRYFKCALDTDFGENSTLCYDGIHAANCGGIWQDVVFGFAGIRADGKVLRIKPSLPSAWKEVSICLFWRDCELKITVNAEQVHVESMNGKEVQLDVCGQTVLLKKCVAVAYQNGKWERIS